MFKPENWDWGVEIAVTRVIVVLLVFALALSIAHCSYTKAELDTLSRLVEEVK